MIRHKIHRGDCVDFGAYGVMYIARVGDGKELWVTKRKWERRNPNAPGQYIEAILAKRIIERYRSKHEVH